MLPVVRSTGWSSSCRRRLPTFEKLWMTTPRCPSTAAAATSQQLLHQQQQRRRLASSRNANGRRSNDDPRKNNGGASTLSTLGNVFGAGMGTFASTLFALYLAAIVETSAHEFLYDRFPHWYADVPEDSLPICLRDGEIARRRGAGAGSMGLGGFPPSEVAHLATTSSWERGMEEERASVIKGEAREFAHVPPPLPSAVAPSSRVRMGAGENGIEDTKTIRQAEASTKLRERLTSVAMTS